MPATAKTRQWRLPGPPAETESAPCRYMGSPEGEERHLRGRVGWEVGIISLNDKKNMYLELVKSGVSVIPVTGQFALEAD